MIAALICAMLLQAPQRDAMGGSALSGAISGRVVDAGTAAPLRNARIGVMPEAGDEPDPVLTDADGRFTVSGLPPGRYTLVVSKPGYVSLRYGARRAIDRPRPIDVPGDSAPLAIRLPRGAAMSGRLVDDLGEPIPDVRVTAGVVVRAGSGMRMTAVRSADTDDLGEYRIAALPAGTYVVSARPGPLVPDGMMAIGMEAPAGAPTYDRLYHPSTPSLSQARQITLRAGDDLSGIDLTFRQVRRPQLTIAVRDSSGAPAAARVECISDEAVSAIGLQVSVDAGGAATTGIDPGDWLLHARGDAGTAVVPITIGESDMQVVVVLARGLTISGRVVYEGRSKPGASVAIQQGSFFRAGTFDAWRVGADDTFTMSGVRDLRQLRVFGMPAGWRVKGLFLNGVDLLANPPVGTAAPIAGAELVLTSVHSEVSGTIVDTRGSVVSDAQVLIYPRDRALLANPDRWARWVRADRQGGFVARDLPAGSYLAVALADVDETRWSSVEYLDALRPRAIAFTLGADEQRVLAVPFTGGQSPP